jgi:pseudouridylate synthase / pseudouridine kinase
MPPLSRGQRRLCAVVTRQRGLSVYSRRNYASRNSLFKVSEEVQDALQNRKPVVALETTIYTHGIYSLPLPTLQPTLLNKFTGFPYPENVALSSYLESLVRVNGGVPATIGFLNGVARVGMQSEELIELVSKAGHPDTVKISRRDLGYLSGLVLATPVRTIRPCSRAHFL